MSRMVRVGCTIRDLVEDRCDKAGIVSRYLLARQVV